MSLPSSTTAGLTFLPRWLDGCSDRAAADNLLTGYAAATNWQRVGVVWPDFGLAASANGVESVNLVPAGAATAPLTPAHRDAGVLWAEPRAGQAWSPDDAAQLTLAARLIERSPALDVWLGPAVNPALLSQRLADAALIAARMAHEFDNILTGVIGFTDLSIPMVPAGSQVAGFLAELNKAGQRGKLFTLQCHELSQCAHAKPQPGSVAVALLTLQTRLAETTPKYRVTADIPSDLPLVAMEAGPLGVVLGHLLNNAAEAHPAGTATVTATVAELSATDARGYLARQSPARTSR